MNKAAFRTKYKMLRETLSTGEIERKSLAIANKTLELPIWDFTYYHIFLPIAKKKEVNTEFLLHILQGKDKSICVPKADFSTFEMQHILLQENTAVKVSDFGIPEPIDGIELSPKKIDVVFVPLLAFDVAGYRVGYGKGFYDRFLSQCKPDCIKIGLSFFEAEEKISIENTDFPIDYCVTPEKIYAF